MYKKIFTHPCDPNIDIELYENEILKLFRGRITEINSEKMFVLCEKTSNDEIDLLFRLIEEYNNEHKREGPDEA